MTGVEINIVVSDCLKAVELYKEVFGEVEIVEASNLPRGENEAVIRLYGVQFHQLDENPQFHLIAPKQDDPKTSWVNVTVPDIKSTYQKAMDLGWTEIQAVTEIADYGVSNAIFMDSFGYVWMLHQVHKVVSHEERLKHWEEKKQEMNNE